MKSHRVFGILVVALCLMPVSPSYAWSQLQWGASWSSYHPEVYDVNGNDYAIGTASPGAFSIESTAQATKNDANSNVVWAIGDVDTSGTVTVVNYDPNDPIILDVYYSVSANSTVSGAMDYCDYDAWSAAESGPCEAVSENNSGSDYDSDSDVVELTYKGDSFSWYLLSQTSAALDNLEAGHGSCGAYSTSEAVITIYWN
jgi:hypothetical protein